uniref:Luciferase-like monooxygenase n=1 Tax=Caulobacter sp. (strain K31) TaxID=366602 RepID=B0T990_CAUSK
MVALSLLDLVRIPQGGDASLALENARALALAAEQAGYQRYWVSEHHNMAGIASAATSIILAHVGAATRTIRLGAGGVMLPNHTPLIIAEQFGTLARLFPGRIDLGVGRADGSVDGVAARALSRRSGEDFPGDVVQLQAFFEDAAFDAPLQAVPAAGTHVPLWILGTSTYGAHLAATLGLPYSFGSHLIPDHLDRALAVYREHFRPSAQLAQPYVMVAVNVAAAETDAQARRLFTTRQMSLIDLSRGRLQLSRPPIDDLASFASPYEARYVDHALGMALVGGPQSLRAQMGAVLERTGADELITVSDIHDLGDRVATHEILASVAQDLGVRGSAKALA